MGGIVDGLNFLSSQSKAMDVEEETNYEDDTVEY